jgi:hypothetical protein
MFEYIMANQIFQADIYLNKKKPQFVMLNKLRFL